MFRHGKFEMASEYLNILCSRWFHILRQENSHLFSSRRTAYFYYREHYLRHLDQVILPRCRILSRKRVRFMRVRPTDQFTPPVCPFQRAVRAKNEFDSRICPPKFVHLKAQEKSSQIFEFTANN